VQLFYYKADAGNFGDDLNSWLWPQLIPNLEASTAADWLVGVGTILDERLLSVSGRKLVLGAGFRPTKWPAVVQPDWDIRFVRGPLTARSLSLPLSMPLSDPALLVANFWPRSEQQSQSVGFVPHFITARSIDCGRACERARVSLIDPRWETTKVLRAISSMDRVIAEGMHGAIVADALGVPWLRLKALAWRRETTAIADFKWADWALSLNLEATPAVSVGIPYHFGRGARVVNRFCSRLQAATLATALEKAAASSKYQLSDEALRQRLRNEMVERVLTAVSESNPSYQPQH
jgi:succinoglycan biosynthesis protein ExoV